MPLPSRVIFLRKNSNVEEDRRMRKTSMFPDQTELEILMNLSVRKRLNLESVVKP